MAVSEQAGSAKVAFWNDPRTRSFLSQAFVIIAIIWLGYEVINNTMINLEKQNIASGFGFLSTTAGFGIIQHLLPYTEASSYGRAFLIGLLNTILLAFIGIILATILGFIVGIMRLSQNWVISKVATVYIETLRNIPLLLQIFFWYFAVLRSVPSPRNSLSFLDLFFVNNRGIYSPAPVFEPAAIGALIALIGGIITAIVVARWAHKRQDATGQQFPVFWTSMGLIVGLPIAVLLLTGFPVTFDVPALAGFNFKGGMVIIPEFVAMLLALAFYTASFIAEIVRAGILAVSHGQTEAAGALGLRRGPILRLVVIPQAMRVIIPPLTSQYLNLTKNSSLAVAIAYPDLVSIFAGTVLNQTGQAVEIILMTMAVYLTLSIVTSIFMNWYNARMALVER